MRRYGHRRFDKRDTYEPERGVYKGATKYQQIQFACELVSGQERSGRLNDDEISAQVAYQFPSTKEILRGARKCENETETPGEVEEPDRIFFARNGFVINANKLEKTSKVMQLAGPRSRRVNSECSNFMEQRVRFVYVVQLKQKYLTLCFHYEAFTGEGTELLDC